MPVITSRYSGKCKSCGKPYRAGDRIFWRKGIRGAMHADCNSATASEPVSSNEPVSSPMERKPASKENGITIMALEWADAKQKFQNTFSNGSVPVSLPGNREIWNEWTRPGNSSAQGLRAVYDLDDASRWLTRGFSVENIDLGNPPIPVREKRRLRYLEEGEELHVDMALSGEDNIFSEWTKREVIPGLAIEIEMGANGSVPGKAIADYNRFVLRAIYALEQSGVDCEILLTQTSIGLYARDDYDRKIPTRINVRVKRENEQLDFNSWSSLLSPAGKRTFMFGMQVLACEQSGETVSSGLGRSTSPAYSVKYDREREVLRFETDSNGQYFPESDMQAQLQQALKEISGREQ